MKILFYCPSKFSLDNNTKTPLGGVETLNLHLAKALSKLGYKVFLCTDCKKITKRQNLVNIPYSKISSNNNDVFDYVVSSNEAKIFDKFKSSKKIFWMHNTLSLEKAVRKGKLLSLLRNNITAVFVSKYLENITSKSYFFNKKIVIPNFLSNDFLIKKINFNRENIFVWSVQRDKGLKEVIEIWINNIFVKDKSAKFYIFGVNKNISKSQLIFLKSKNIYFYGRVSKATLKKTYQKSLAMICLGYDETFCLNALEANSCGLPIITFAKTALKDFSISNYNSIIIDNFNELENKIHFLISLNTLGKKKLITNSFNHSKKYHINTISKLWSNLFKDK